MQKMTSKAKDDYWRTTGILRHITRNKLQQEILLSGFMISKTASEIENNFYVHARNREEYLTYNARLILNFREMGHKERNASDNGDNNPLVCRNEDSISELKIVIETRAINDIVSELNYLYMTALDDLNDTHTQTTHQNRMNRASDNEDNIAIDISEDSDSDYFQVSAESANIAPHISLKPEMSSRKIWCGILEFQIKRAQQSSSQSLANPSKKTILNYSLNCEIFAHTVRGEPELYAQQWPEKLLLSIISRNIIDQLMPVLAEKSHHLGLNFVCHTPDSEFTIVKLTKIMSQNFCGCVQFSADSNVRIMIVLYLADKRMFVGFVPYDQNEFFHTIKQLIERNRTDQRIITRRSVSMTHTNSSNGFVSYAQSALRSSSAPSAVNRVQNPILLSLLNQ